MCDPIVEVEQGKLKGNVRKTKGDVQYYSFKSIPYAKPPVGHLRFSIPQPPEPWEGIKDATLSCNICAQFDRLTKVVVGDEDCLYLNVYTPKLPSADCAALPVMVFFHGGGFVFGNGTDDSVHGPDFLIEKDVVIVSLNYRLGILGFLSLNCKEAPGNMGLRDQVQALKWVQKNITNFGGDPTNVTIFGISAGGASVEYLVLSRMAKGLFHKAIAQSGSSLNHWAHNNNIKELAALMPVLQAKILSGTEELLQYLKDLPIKNLIMFSMAAIAANSHKGGIHFGFVPTVETPSDWEPFLDKSPYDLLANGEFTKVPYISGFCDREGLLMLGLGAAALEKVVKGKEFTQFLPFEIDQTQIPEVEKKFKLAYLEGEKKYDEPDAFAIDYFGDVDFIAGVYVAASLIAKNNSCPVYFYEFSYDGGFNYMKKKISIDRKGACHGDDGGYLVKSGLLTGDCCGVDQLVRDRMVEMWSSFAKYGEPTPQTGELIPIKWDPVAETGISCLCINNDLTMKEDIYSNRMKLYKDLYEKYKLTK